MKSVSNFTTAKKLFLIISLFGLFTACNEGNTSGINTDDDNYTVDDTQTYEEVDIPEIEPVEIDSIDLGQDVSGMSLAELRLLRNTLFAQQGYLFMKADLRAYFDMTDWYSDVMWERWEKDDNAEPITFTDEEKALIDKITARETELLKQNYVTKNGQETANIENVVNFFQFTDLSDEFLGKLSQNGFVISEGNNIQFFHVYEENDYRQIPNFVTTDMYLQLFHMYFSYLLKSLEQDKFIPILKDMVSGMYDECTQIASTHNNAEVQAMAEFNEAYYAIAYYLLTDKELPVSNKYEAMYKAELINLESEEDTESEFMDFTEAAFPYSLYKPRGHYTRSDDLKRYFKTMMWLQTAVFCREKNDYLKRAAFQGQLLNSSVDSKTFLERYKAIFEPIVFLIGKPDNLSMMDMNELINEKGYKGYDFLVDASKMDAINEGMIKIAEDKNMIKPKEQISCTDKINFMPQRYLADNEVLQDLVDTESETTQRGYPKGLDVMAIFGSKAAENLLFNFYKEDEQWSDYQENYDKLKGKFGDYDEWNNTVYMKWVESLLKLQERDKSYPPFMQTDMWDRKNANTALASWAELKHDAILYAEQPMGAECGGGGPPEPITVGYVEPNIRFWNTTIDLINLTRGMLERNGLMNEDIMSKTDQVHENAQFLKTASEKELKGETLTDQEYQSIEIIGSTYEYLTLDLLSEQWSDGWYQVKGPDKSVAVVADVYTANSSNNPDKGILHVAVGNVNDIYVIVEIEGLLYLTKGATFSYYEFPQPLGTRLTDEEWQKMLEDGKAPPIPAWMKDIIIQENAPEVDERMFYSSGC